MHGAAPRSAIPAPRSLRSGTSASTFHHGHLCDHGPVGSGKAALARCLAGLYPPESGKICVDGVSACAAATGLIGYAPREGYLFSGSVRDNVVLEAAPLSAKLDRVVDLPPADTT